MFICIYIYIYIVCPSGSRRPPHDRLERTWIINRFGYFGELCVRIVASCLSCWPWCLGLRAISSSRELPFWFRKILCLRSEMQLARAGSSGLASSTVALKPK
jgi:hypothetical protein